MAACAHVHPTAIVSPEAELADDVAVGAHCVIEGKVTNNDSQMAIFVNVVATCYDASGKIVDVGNGEIMEIKPGAIQPFSIDDLGVSSTIPIVRYDLFFSGITES